MSATGKEPDDTQDEEAPNSVVIGEELRDDAATDEKLISGGMPD